MKNIFYALLIIIPHFLYAEVTEKEMEHTPKNIIMIIADGMGPAHTTAYRYFRDNPKTTPVETTIFDKYLVGSISTYPAEVSGYVTDSAAGATALASGVKTYNGAIGLNVDKQEVPTVLELARIKGKKIGVVVTSAINHATPASYLSHNESRKNYDAIANSYIDEKINSKPKMDVIFGGGKKYFLRKDRNLVNEFIQSGFQYIDSYEQLSTLQKNKPVMGLFADDGLPSALDDKNNHRLSTMTKAAIPLLENENGFFMLIEASQVDWGGHGNDIALVMNEMDDLAKTIKYIEEYSILHPNTLVVITADHSTGGLTVAANNKYIWQPNVLRTMKMSTLAIAKAIATDKISATTTHKLFNFELTNDEISELKMSKKNAQLDEATSKKKPGLYEVQSVSKTVKALHKTVKLLIDKRTNTGWTTHGHTAIDVPISVLGPKRDLFFGHHTNSDIAKILISLL